MNNDLISRSGLLFVLENEYFPAKGEFARAMDIARFAIQDAPAVDAVEVVHGEWIERKEIFAESEGEVDAIGCSECNKSQRKYRKTSFCPNCGADMREEK